MSQQQFSVTNIKCAACTKMICLIVRKLGGVEQVIADEASGLVTVTSAAPIDLGLIREKLSEKGYQVKE